MAKKKAQPVLQKLKKPKYKAKKLKTKPQHRRKPKIPISVLDMPVGNVVKRQEDLGKPRYTPLGYLPNGHVDQSDTDRYWWNRRAKQGRDITFTDPLLLWEAACEYFQWCNDVPWVRYEARSTRFGIEKVQIPTSRPMTLTGLCLYLDCSTEFFQSFKSNLISMVADPLLKNNFSRVITVIEQTIYTQKFEGAAVGAFNATIISRDLGLADNLNLNMGVRKSIAELFPVAAPDDEKIDNGGSNDSTT